VAFGASLAGRKLRAPSNATTRRARTVVRWPGAKGLLWSLRGESDGPGQAVTLGIPKMVGDLRLRDFAKDDRVHRDLLCGPWLLSSLVSAHLSAGCHRPEFGDE
jgi:hypothetical protein